MKTSLLISSALILAGSTPIFAQDALPDSIEGSYYNLEDLVVVANKPNVINVMPLFQLG